MVDDESTVLDSIRSGQSVKYDVFYNLEKKFPKIVRLAINDWSGFSPNIRISQIICDNSLSESNASIFLQARV